MATLAQLAANLMNAQKSTGPNTTNGKSRSKLNAVKHGLCAQTVLLPNDDALAYKVLCQKYQMHYRPANFAEETVCQQIADTAWRLGRCFALSENVFSSGHITGDGNMLMSDPSLHAAVTAPKVLKNNVPSLEAVSRATSRLDRTLKSAMEHMAALQKERRAGQQRDFELAATVRKYCKTMNLAFIPLDSGFVMTVEKIDAYISRHRLIDAALKHQKLLPKAA